MDIKTLFFGITTDLVGASNLYINAKKGTTVSGFKQIIKKKHSLLKNIDSYAIAVNEEYAADDLILKENDIVAVIPPVSGG